MVSGTYEQGGSLEKHTHDMYRISLTIVDTPGFGDNIDNEQW